jgi:hypothetical protein
MKAKVETWLEQIRTGAIKSNLVRVLKHIQDAGIHGTSIYDMRETLGMSHQSLTATISQLADEGLLFEAGQFQVKTSWYTIYIYVSNENARKEIAQKRRQEKFMQWLERGLNEYDDMMFPETKKHLENEKHFYSIQLGI